MKSTNLGNIAIANVGVKKSAFPRNRNVYTSCGFGEVQPLQVLHCDADTDTTFSVESKMYLEPIVAPTYGHCKCEFWSYFVEYSDLFDRFKEIFSETPRVSISTTGANASVPTTLPWCYRSLLSTLMLWGSFLTIYKVVPSADGTRKYTALVLDDSSQTTDVANELQALSTLLNYHIQTLQNADSSIKALNLSTSLNDFGTYGLAIDARTLIECPVFNDSSVSQNLLKSSKFTIPLANPDMYTLVDYRPSDSFQLNINTRGVDITPVSIRGADVLIERPFVDSNNNTVYYAFAFRLNAFGKRIYKVFKGAGFQEDFYSYDKKVSLMPLFAVYKAYFECFGLLAYSNYESTSLASLLYDYSLYGATDSIASNFSLAFASRSPFSSLSNYAIQSPRYYTFKQFVLDLGSMWVTDSQDFVSAQETGVTNVPNPSEGRNLNDYLQTFSHGGGQDDAIIASNNTSSEIQAASPDLGAGNSQHLYIHQIIHGQLDSEILKKMYQLINVETIAGKRVEQLLRAQGYGDWVDHCKARFIAHDEFAVEFSQVTSLSDTLKDGSGMILGERGGRGEAYNMGRTHKYKNDEAGFLVTLMAVVPDAGYTNTLNPAFDAITKYDFFTPVFDGVGKELLEVNQVVGEMPTCLVDVTESIEPYNKTDKSFGVSPRGSKWKVTHNTRNGVFALRSVRDSYLPYILDKVIKMGDVVDTEIKDDTGTWASSTSVKLLSVDALQYFPQKQLPLAGLAWRYPTRYPWIGMFSRIFAMVGDAVDAGNILGRLGPQLQSYEFLNSELDGFDILSTIRMTTYEHKLPITDSYETLEDGNDGKIDTNISKA